MTNLVIGKRIIWTDSGTSFITNFQMFPEEWGFLLRHNNVSLLFSACSLEYIVVLCRPLLIWISYSSHLIMAVLDFRASVKDVRLSSHQLGEFLTFCLSLLSTSFLGLPPFRSLPSIRTKPGNFPTLSSYVAVLISSMRSN